MDDTGINKFLHQAMGKCWHQWKRRDRDYFLCVRCRETAFDVNDEPSIDPLPNYCTSLDAVAVVEAFVIECKGFSAYERALTLEIREEAEFQMQSNLIMAAIASAKTRATACYKVLGGQID